MGSYAMRFGVTIVERLAGLVIVPLLVAEVGLDGVGYYGLSSSLVLVFVNVVCLRFPMAMIRYMPGDRAQAGRILAIGLLFWLGFAACSSLVVLLAPQSLSDLAFANSDKVTLLGLAVAAGLLTTLYEFLSVPLRAENRFGWLSIVDTAERLIFLAACLAVFSLGYRSVEAVLMVLVATCSLRILAVVGPSLRGVGWPVASAPGAREMFAFCLPFLPHLASVWIIERSAFLFVAQRIGQEAVGLFTLAFALAGVLTAVVFPLQTTLYPMLSRAYDQNRVELVRDLMNVGLRIALTIGAFGTISLCVGTPHVLDLLGIGAATPPLVLMLVMALAFTLGSVRQVIINVLHIRKDTRALVWISPLGAVVAVAAGALLMLQWGIAGAAAGILLGTLAQVIGMCWRVPSSLLGIPSPSFLYALCGASAIALLAQTVTGRSGPWVYLAGLLVSGVLYLAVLYGFGGVTPSERSALRGRFAAGEYRS
jgi:O-antigen/teichoic acid export membrane protein